MLKILQTFIAPTITRFKEKGYRILQQNSKKCSDKDWFLNIFQFVVQVICLHDRDRMYKQISSILIRGSCSSILAIIYLHVYEKTRKGQQQKHKISRRQHEIEKKFFQIAYKGL